MLYIYILKCQYNKYYVGKTYNIKKRMKEHKSNEGSVWTKKYPMIKLIRLVSNCDIYDEDKYTLMYMDRYGIENVRGGTYCRVILPDYQIKTLNDQLRHNRNLCFICGQSKHYVSKCPNKKKD